MIDLNLYRFRIGVFSQCKFKAAGKSGCNVAPTLGGISNICLMGYIFYIYYVLYILSLSMAMAVDSIRLPISCFSPHPSVSGSLQGMINVKLMFVILVSFAIERICCRGFLRSCLTLMLLNGDCLGNDVLLRKHPKRIHRLLSVVCSWVFCINFLLISVVNPSLLNPGPPKTSLSVVYQNVHGLIPFSQLDRVNPNIDTTKVLEINSFLSIYKPDIFVLNETWLKKSVSDSEILPLDQYKVFRLDRSVKTHPPDPNFPKKFRRNGGGVLISIRRDIDVVSTKIDIKCDAEILGITLKFNDGRKAVFCTCYRVGTLGATNHSSVDSYLQKIRLRRGISNIFVVGDFNMPKVQWDQFHSRDNVDQLFLNTFSNLAFDQLIDVPTHIKGNILDLLLSNNPRVVSDIKVDNGSQLCKSDHYMISFNIISKVKKKKLAKREIYNFKRADWESINNELVLVDWDSLLLSNDNIEFAWSRFKNKLFLITDRHIPKIMVDNSSQPPWFDSETHNLCREKERLRSRYKQSKSTEHYVQYSDSRRRFKRTVQQKMRDNFSYDEDDSSLITKKFWSYVKSTSSGHRIPEVVHLDDVYRTDHPEQAELFNNYFYRQFSERSNYNIQIQHNRHGRSDDIDFNADRVRTILSGLNVNKAIGPDLIHGRVLKNCAGTLSYPLSILFKLSYYTSTIPKEWKMAHVVPVHKKGSKANVENYRPISLTSLVMKTFERIIRDELMFRCNEYINSRQHGFLPSKSCCTQMVGFCDSLSISLNKSIRTDVIYFDFAKAFDSVNHDLILMKLKTLFNIDGFLLGFIRAYLMDRKQSVVLGNCVSPSLPVLSGVPQGSIVGPSLFVLFINDISSGLSMGSHLCLYADDTKLWREIAQESDHLILQKDIDFLRDWAIQNKMKFHPDKCKVLMVSHSKPPLLNILPFIQFFYALGSVLIDYCDFEKDLGIIINGNLNFTHHADLLYSKANQKLGLLRRTCHFVQNIRKKRALYLSLVRSLFEHCPIIWRPSATSTIDKLETIQKRAFKWILNDIHVSFSSTYMYHVQCRQFNILPIRFRFDYHDLKFFHSVVHGFSCVTLPEYIRPFTGSSLRSSHLDSKSFVSSVTPKNLTTMSNSASKRGFDNSYFYRAHLAWNRLPLDMRETVSPGLFKVKLIEYIWKEYIPLDDPLSWSDGADSDSYDDD
jgi:hypothetical protein